MEAIYFVLFFPTAFILLWGAHLVSSYFTVNFHERFWIFISLVSLQLGSITSLLSIFKILTPWAWIILQTFIFSIIAFIFRKNILQFNINFFVYVYKNFVNFFVFIFYNKSKYITTILMFFIISFLMFSCLEQYITPIIGGDERMYHASRVCYWIQNQSCFPYITHNDRQTVFSFGSELFFLFPILFTKSELIGRMFFWIGYPLVSVGFWILLRELGMGAKTSLAGIVVLLATPIISRYAVSTKPAIWLIFFSIGTAFWAVKSCKNSIHFAKSIFFLGLFAALSVHMKFTALSLMPAAFVLTCLVNSRNIFSRIGYLLFGIAFATLFSALIAVFGFNFYRHNNILGPEEIRKTHRSQISLRQIYTHAIRLPTLLFELPQVNSPNIRRHMNELGNELISFLHADKPLPLEREGNWPGLYHYEQDRFAQKFSLGGILWLPILAFGLVFVIRDIFSDFPQLMIHSPLSALIILDIFFLCAIVFLVRWMAHSGVPERLLLGPYPLGLATSVVFLKRLLTKWRFARITAFLILLYMACPPMYSQASRLQAKIHSKTDLEQTDAPFTEALKHIVPGSHILLVGSQGCFDYALFAPRDRYSNTVTSWGKFRFSGERMEETLNNNGDIDYILIEDDRMVCFFGDFCISTGEMCHWLIDCPYFREIQLNEAHVHLFKLFHTKISKKPYYIKTIQEDLE